MTGYVRHSSYRRGNRSRRSFRKRRVTGKRVKRRFRGRRRTFRGRRGVVAKLSRKVRLIQSRQDGSMGTFINREHRFSQILIPQTDMSNDTFDVNAVINLEDMISQLRYFNPLAPTDLVTGDFSLGTYSKSVTFEQSYGSLTLRANYLVPVNYTVYLCTMRDDTDFSPISAYTEGIKDITASGATIVNTLLYPTDVPLCTALYHWKRVKHGLLQPGGQVVCSHSSKRFAYDTSVTDTHDLSFQKQYGAFFFYVRCTGVVSHDSIMSQFGYANARLDVLFERSHKIVYDAGADIKFIRTVTNGGTVFTNQAVITNKAAASNQTRTIGLSTF